MEISRLEVLEEEELLKMKQEQLRFQDLRNKENAETKSLEEKEKKLLKENVLYYIINYSINQPIARPEGELQEAGR